MDDNGGELYWISYYLTKGHSLEYLLNLKYDEKQFFIESMAFSKKLQVKYDESKIKAMNGEG